MVAAIWSSRAELAKATQVPRCYEVGSSISKAHTSVEAFYRQTYYEVMDYVGQAINFRSDQDG